MTTPLRIWLHISPNPAYRSGGWAWMRGAGKDISGAAGGDREVTAERLELIGLQKALSGLTAGGSLEIHTAAARLRRLPRIAAGETLSEAEAVNADLWMAVLALIGKRPVTVALTPVEPRMPMGFIAAWADLGRDKAKSSGAFSAPIPKTNFAKVAALLDSV
jgi:hypothetical protein